MKNRALHILIITIVVAVAFLGFGCDDNFGEVVLDSSPYNSGEGVFILNEGNFNSGNGSISFYRPDSAKIINNVFYRENSRPIGDVPQDIAIHQGRAFVTVNNSGTIEIIRLDDFVSIGKIPGLASPKYLLPVASDRVFVTDLYSDSIAVINPEIAEVSGYINVGYSTDRIIRVGGEAWTICWSQLAHPDKVNNQLIIVNIDSQQVVDSIRITKEPNSLVQDANGNIWVLCSGGFMNTIFPSLLRINPATRIVEAAFEFPSKTMSPSMLCINKAGDKLIFLNKSIYQMDIDAGQLPSAPLIDGEGSLFYAIGVDPVSDWIYVSDAIDYQQSGIVYIYDNEGNEMDECRSGIIPGNFCFNR